MAKTKKVKSVEKKLDQVQEALQDPQVLAIIERYKDTAARWNNIAQFLAGNSKVSEEVTPEQHVRFLAQAYYFDVLFLLEQLGVVKAQEPVVEENQLQEEVK